MNSHDRQDLGDFHGLTTAHLADACLRGGIVPRCAASSIRPVVPGMRCGGRVRPVRHFGSADVFLEAIETAAPGDVLVIDNGGRPDEACVGDLVVLESKMAGLAGIVVWGRHRDTAELAEIGLPVFSLGALPCGPRRLDPRRPDALIAAAVGRDTVTSDDMVFADGDGVLFFPAVALDTVRQAAEQIRSAEQEQAARLRDGLSLRRQFHFDRFLARRAMEPDHTFRQHLKTVGGAIEE